VDLRAPVPGVPTAGWQTSGVDGLRMLRGGRGNPVLLLLHGLGATGDVFGGWRSWLERRWPGQWLAPDLPGHGASPPLPEYTFDGLAATLAPEVRTAAGGAPIVVLGHSLGGAVGLALADERRGLPVRAVIGLGIKVEWTEEELARARALAERPPTWYDTRGEAAARYLRVAGLTDLLSTEDEAVDAGLRQQDGRWGLALDPRAFAVGAPDMAGLLARCSAVVTLARGEHDPMNTDEQLSRLGAPTRTLAGLGHNAHVESPERAATLLEPYTDER
jgi:pimeloyl-ACP methyl ester carboxylesterase